MFCLSRSTVLFCCVLVVTLANVAGRKQCNGGSAKCVTLESCTGLYKKLSPGATESQSFNKLLQRELFCGFTDMGERMVCCPPGYANESSSGFDPISLLPTKKTCGIQNSDRIFGGVRTEIDEHPWMALIRLFRKGGSVYICDGALISERYVLTAAHCADSLTSEILRTEVILGEWNTSSKVDCVAGECSPPPQRFLVEETFVHERFDIRDMMNDIALLRLDRNVQFSDFVKPICLPLSNELRQSTFSGKYLEVAGWGKTESGKPSDVKLKVRLPVVSFPQCVNFFKRVNRVVGNKQICAGGVAGEDSCFGDSGGPLMDRSPQSNNWVAVGIVSYGSPNCGAKGWPAIYTRVGAYIDWILSKLKP